ncbi:murein biosynthesis integral membrane protein MurJ [Microbacterium radiodurans]|uniref:Murein biosynthesis integral membrane protein MurJ n=1 Tax=Microbacterium radiodurans TaxID=661398 RepID=A0A5J5IT15_9MICO|nr:murein biosynthesis integral membrane protein MurJ [Microbacterium radiodurans]KAA9089244.1 murein biosynthesis integral membrane protein MurJ [Microbacterium radiodurans]
MSGIGRAGATVAAGTLVSRITGLVRNVVLAAALPVIASNATGGAADAFAIANQLPNNIYAIISSGLLAGVIVPQIIQAAKHRDGGSAFVSKLLTLGLTALFAATVIAVVAAPLLVFAFGSRLGPEASALTLAFAYWCLPQLLFYGMYALLGEILNARGVFGPFAWSPIVNNVVSIIGFLAFIWLFGVQEGVVGWTPTMVAVIAGTATLGIIAQAAVLLFFWRRAGLHVRPDFAWRGIGLRHIGRLAGWTFLMVVAGQLAGLVQTTLVSAASSSGASVAAMQYAWLVFMLPFSVIVLSIGTPYFTRLSEHVAQNRPDALRADLDSATRTIGIFMVGALAAVIAAILPISRVFTTGPETAVSFAWVLAAYLVALLPLSFQFVLQRTFYAHQDTRTPFVFTLVQAILVAATALTAYLTLPVEQLAVGIALGQSLANIVQLVLAVALLRRKIGVLGLGGAVRAVARFVIAGVPAAAAGWGVIVAFGGPTGWPLQSREAALLGGAIVGVTALGVYVCILAILRAPELAVAGRALRRFRRR